MKGRNRSEIIGILQQLPLFSAFTQRQLRALAGECSDAHYEPGEHIVKELDHGQHMVVIVSGKAKVVRGGKTLATVGPGDAIGEMSVIDREPRSASVVAEDDVAAIVIYGTAFRRLLQEHPEMVGKLLQAQTARLRALDTRASVYG
jgi:CRP/FNR family transcriptional regulator, cyclic AMP receptor protein